MSLLHRSWFNRANGLPLRSVLVVPFVIEIAVAVGLTGWFAWRTGQRTVHDLVVQLQLETNARIEQKLTTFLQIPPHLNRLNQNALELGYVDPHDSVALYQHFFQQAQAFEDANAIFWGDVEGEFVGNGHFNADRHQRMLAGSATGGAIQFHTVDSAGRPIILDRETLDFDPRDRSWYKAAVAAGQPTWGEIFTYHAYARMAIPAVMPLYDAQGELLGVLGNNFFLTQISEFLAQLNVGPNGQTYIIERSGELVASSTLPQPFTVTAGVTERINASQSKDPLLQTSAQFILETYGNFEQIQDITRLSFSHSQGRQFLQVSPFQDELGLDWLIVVVMPEADFMAPINANIQNFIWLCAGALGITIALGWLTSRWIMRPLQRLITAADEISSGQLEQDIPPAQVRELSRLGKSFNRMANHLEASFSQLRSANQAFAQTNQALQDSEEKFRQFAQNSNAVLWIYDRELQTSVYVSPAFETVWGRSCASLRQDHEVFLQAVHPDDRSLFSQTLADIEQTRTFLIDYRIVRPDGTIRWIRDRAFTLNNNQWLGGIAEDITDRKTIEQALVQSESQYRLLAENMSDLVCLHTPEGHYLYISSSIESLLGYHPRDLLGHQCFDLIHPSDRDRIQREIQQLLDGTALLLTYRIRKKAGDYRWFETVARALLNPAGQVIQLQTTSRDVTAKVRLQRQLEHDAFHDALTGLPNRNLLRERLDLAIRRIHQQEIYQFAVLFLDLDRFNVVNDSLGHLAGDEVLIEAAHRLQSTLTSKDVVARLGGDEFVILLEEIKGLHEAIRITEQIETRFQEPFWLNEHRMFIGASVGIVLGTVRYQQPDQLIRDADTAMYRAKGKGRSRYEVFDPAMHAQAFDRLHLETDLRHALERNELFVCYQPLVHLETGELKGFEALIRWQHPERGLVSPGEFIPIAEETHQIIPIGLWLMQTVAEQLVAWQAQRTAVGDSTPLTVSVNVSAIQLRDAGFMAMVDQVLATTQIPGAQLTFEITESILIEDVEAIADMLRRLRNRGIAISIDDFGTGYSSLSYLCDLPFTTLKIDKSFVSRMVESRKNRRVVETILTLTRLGMASVAEGVETAEQLALLQQLGCTYGQGYFFGKPAPAAVAQQWITGHSFRDAVKGLDIRR
ncbi:MAG: EAL domain-containing protein [Spirulina sp. SIO3F2]|nr:EAL domain-containing protein [Spirulina sp. SIO3F2]